MNPTDNISTNSPEPKKAFQGLFDQMVKKPRYDKNVKSSSPWEPRRIEGYQTLNNRSGQAHNIITNENNTVSGTLQSSSNHVRSHNRLKGIAEINEATHSSAIK